MPDQLTPEAQNTLWYMKYIPTVQDVCHTHGVRLLYLVVSGSHAYGTNTPESDVDVRGVFLPGKKHVLGTRNIREISFGADGKLHELRSYMAKLEKGTPNLLDWLFVPDDCRLYVDPAFQSILDKRSIFVTKRLYPRLTGYAVGQLKKMGHATRESGAKRKKLIEDHGYDTKNAVHLLRLLYLAEFVLEFGDYYVRVGPGLKDILQRARAGEYSLDQVKQLAEQKLKEVDAAYEKCTLPACPDMHTVDRLCIELFEEVWR